MTSTTGSSSRQGASSWRASTSQCPMFIVILTFFSHHWAPSTSASLIMRCIASVGSPKTISLWSSSIWSWSRAASSHQIHWWDLCGHLILTRNWRTSWSTCPASATMRGHHVLFKVLLHRSSMSWHHQRGSPNTICSTIAASAAPTSWPSHRPSSFLETARYRVRLSGSSEPFIQPASISSKVPSVSTSHRVTSSTGRVIAQLHRWQQQSTKMEASPSMWSMTEHRHQVIRVHLVSLVNSIKYGMVIGSSMTIRASDTSFGSVSVASAIWLASSSLPTSYGPQDMASSCHHCLGHQLWHQHCHHWLHWPDISEPSSLASVHDIFESIKVKRVEWVEWDQLIMASRKGVKIPSIICDAMMSLLLLPSSIIKDIVGNIDMPQHCGSRHIL